MSARAKMILLVLVAAAVAAVAVLVVVLADGGGEEPAAEPDPSTSAPKEPIDEADVAEQICLENPENTPEDCKG